MLRRGHVAFIQQKEILKALQWTLELIVRFVGLGISMSRIAQQTKLHRVVNHKSVWEAYDEQGDVVVNTFSLPNIV